MNIRLHFRYLVTMDSDNPFFTNWFEPENHFNPDVNMIVYDYVNAQYTKDGITWHKIEEDHL